MDMKWGAIAMENVQHCRAMGSLFRQFAVFDPVHSWKYFSLQIFVTRAVSGGWRHSIQP